MVPGTGIEPVRCLHRGILSPLRLPISPPGPDNAREFYSGKLAKKMEAEGGIEPPSTALQAAA